MEKINYLTYKKLDDLNVVNMFLNRENGHDFLRTINDGIRNKESYEMLYDMLEISEENLVWLNQTHSDNIVIAEKPGLYNDADSVITNKKNLYLTIRVADCINIFIYDPINKVIANVHSGWRGTVKRITSKTIEKMKEKFNSNPEDLIVCISPSIRKECFEVKEDVKKLFEEEFKELDKDKFITKKDEEHFLIDSVYCVKETIKALGVKEENIEDSMICTVCESDKYHSYRVDKEMSGRNLGILALK